MYKDLMVILWLLVMVNDYLTLSETLLGANVEVKDSCRWKKKT